MDSPNLIAVIAVIVSLMTFMATKGRSSMSPPTQTVVTSTDQPAKPPIVNGNGSLSFSGWGASITTSGPVVTVLIVLMAGFGGIGWILHTGFSDLKDAQTDVLSMLFRIQDQHESAQQAQQDLACVLAMPQDVRPDAIADPFGSCHYATGYARDRRAVEKSQSPPPKQIQPPSKTSAPLRPQSRAPERPVDHAPQRPTSTPVPEYPVSGFPAHP